MIYILLLDPFIEFDREEAEQYLKEDMSNLDEEINNARNALRKGIQLYTSDATSLIFSDD